MAKDKTREDGGSDSTAVIGEDARLEGTLRSASPLHVSGYFKGFLIAENELVISSTGRVEAKVKARRAVLSGQFEGEMIVLEAVEITSTCRFKGTLIQKEPGLIVEDGGRFEGQSLIVDDLEMAAADWEKGGFR